MRGEYDQTTLDRLEAVELPPRARRILQITPWVPRPDGTTSACAENTRVPRLLRALDRNYLRVRGEYPRISKIKSLAWELPPRARRIHHTAVGGRHI